MTLILFLCKAIGISLSGVMAPGAVTAATISAGSRSRHAGALIAVGHGFVEFPLMFLIMAGMGKLFKSESVKIAIGLAGGIFLLWMASGMLRELSKHTQSDEPSTTKARSPLWIGVILSAGNPYFLLWWATIGLALATQARELGVFAFALFAIIHWLCDLVWLEVLSFTSFKGSELFGPRKQRLILLICTIAIFAFAAWFLFDAFRALIRLMAA